MIENQCHIGGRKKFYVVLYRTEKHKKQFKI